ncbi:hypothetical protein BZA05DRAFT_430663 [Tricharina praecox]|uniref:uncharacterized protein n=1 Tax=Tricharina praecox TaxID=43433 RepID=UPI00221FFDAA|nr:uncharacterized protein BZA05DRAFT_430663 [Tricharina praecox]KAI5849911.1 hypothetical protein BZA05DRAFT_430663 [Tricharina praecox]
MPQKDPDVLGPLWHIPCLCEPNDYDKQGFFDYPSRHGWRIDYTTDDGPVRVSGDGKTLSSSAAEKVAFLQAWLFFGMLHEAFRIFEVPIDLEEFVVRPAEGSVQCITTFPARQYFGQCIDAGKRTIKSCVKAHEDLAKLFKLVSGMISRYEDTVSPTSWRISDVLPLDAILCIQVLGESLINLAKITIHVPLYDSALADDGKVGFNRATNPLQARMLQGGWCISATTMLHDLLDTTSLYIASHHSSCTKVQCYANQVDEDTYETKHTEDCQGCEHISVDVEQVVSILRKGQIPLLEVVTDRPYVALSHAWAQGLGNAHNNSLPYCQLSRIKGMISELNPSVSGPKSSCKLAIWVDTLCIPVAITRLATTYYESEHVLVLDTGLMTTSRLASRMEKCTRILSSAWFRRLWTYQEAVLSKNGNHGDKLQIQFSDGPSLWHSENALYSLLLMLPLHGNVAVKLTYLARVLQYRRTSRQEDEAICLTSVLGYDRMAVFYSLVDRVPRNLIFGTTPRLETAGARIATAENADFRSITPPTWPHRHFSLTEGPGKRHWSLRPVERKSGKNQVEWNELSQDLEAGAVILNQDRKVGLHALVSILREDGGTRFCRFLKLGVITVGKVERVPNGVPPLWCMG